jgi:hypothetical protein
VDEDSDQESLQARVMKNAMKWYGKGVEEIQLVRKMWKKEGPVETIKEFKWLFGAAFITVWIFISSVMSMFRGKVWRTLLCHLIKKGSSVAAKGDKKKKDGKQKDVEPSVVAAKETTSAAKKRSKAKAAKEAKPSEDEEEEDED